MNITAALEQKLAWGMGGRGKKLHAVQIKNIFVNYFRLKLKHSEIKASTSRNAYPRVSQTQKSPCQIGLKKQRFDQPLF